MIFTNLFKLEKTYLVIILIYIYTECNQDTEDSMAWLGMMIP